MADTDIWMPLYVDDYIADTRHLSTAEHGAYLLLILHAWRRGGSLPGEDERLRRIAGMTPREWKASWPTLRELFKPDGEGYRHKRVDAELAKANAITEKRRAASNARWNKERASKSNASAYANDDAKHDAKAMQRTSQPQPQPQPQEEEKESPPLLPHRALAFSGGVVRVNHRDFEAWQKTYHGIPDLHAALTALDEWIVEASAQDHTVPQRWRRMVTSQLDKKHQAWLAEMRKADEGGVEFTSPC